MKLFRALASLTMVLGAAGWLMADTMPDPIIKMTIPGLGTFDLCDVAAAGESCTITLHDGFPNTTIGDDGFGSFAVKNIDDKGLAIDSISFLFRTDNLNQPFSASSNDYTTAAIVKHPSFCDGDFCSDSTLEVDFFGVQKPGDPGSTSVDAVFCEGDGCPSAIGFVPHSDVVVTAHFDVVPDPLPCCDGLQPGEEGGVSLSPDVSTTVPEPSAFVLLFGAAGILAVKRRLSRS